MNDKIIIRSGKPEDAADMAEIYNHYVRESDVIFSNKVLSEQEMRDKIARLNIGTRFPFLIAELEGHAAGYAYAHLWQPDPVYDRTWELTMYLNHNSLGHGIGTALMERLVAECKLAGAHTLISCITDGNTACERMHDRAGFTRACALPETGYKFGRFLNDVIYYRIL